MYRVFEALDELGAIVEEARGVPMTAGCVVPRGDVLELIDDIKDAIPGELDDAQDVLDARDGLLREARRENPRAARAVLIDEAAALVEAQQIFISFGQPVRWSLVGGGIDGFQTNALGVHPLMEIAMQPR